MAGLISGWDIGKEGRFKKGREQNLSRPFLLFIIIFPLLKWIV